MHIKVASAAFVRALALASRVAERKTTVPILSNLKIETAGETKITVSGTDLELGLMVGVDASVIEPGAITIPARRLHDYVRLLPEGEVAIKTDEKSWASITSGKSRSRIAGMAAEGFPELPPMPESQGGWNATNLLRMLARTEFAISKELSRFTINGALLYAPGVGSDPDSGGVAHIVATDGHRLALVEFGCAYKWGRVLLPVSVIRMLPSLDCESFMFSQDDNHVWFLGDNGVLLMGRKLVGNFPDYNRVLPKSFKVTATASRGDLAAALSRVSQFSDERSRCTRFALKDNVLTVSAATADAGESTEDVPCTGSGEIEIGLSSQYVADFLNAVDCDSIAVSFNDAQSAVEFRIAGADDYRYVVMPMRL
jgi:DNA polymerase III subunit beta